MKVVAMVLLGGLLGLVVMTSAKELQETPAQLDENGMRDERVFALYRYIELGHNLYSEGAPSLYEPIITGGEKDPKDV